MKFSVFVAPVLFAASVLSAALPDSIDTTIDAEIAPELDEVSSNIGHCNQAGKSVYADRQRECAERFCESVNGQKVNYKKTRTITYKNVEPGKHVEVYYQHNRGPKGAWVIDHAQCLDTLYAIIRGCEDNGNRGGYQGFNEGFVGIDPRN